MRSLRAVLVLGLMGLSLNACRTDGVFVKESPLNLSETRKAIVTVIGPPRLISRDGRALDSNYYDKNSKPIANPDKVKERYSSHIVVVGDRRPYDLEVQVVVEEKDETGHYVVVDTDQLLAAPLAEKIKKELYQSLDGSNLIDDFRPF